MKLTRRSLVRPWMPTRLRDWLDPAPKAIGFYMPQSIAFVRHCSPECKGLSAGEIWRRCQEGFRMMQQHRESNPV